MPRESRARLAPDLLSGRSPDPAFQAAPSPRVGDGDAVRTPAKKRAAKAPAKTKGRSVGVAKQRAKSARDPKAEPPAHDERDAGLAETIFHRKGAATAATFRPWYWRY